MYDKVKLWTARTRETPDVSKFLDRAKDQIDHETGEVCTFGSLEGLKVYRWNIDNRQFSKVFIP